MLARMYTICTITTEANIINRVGNFSNQIDMFEKCSFHEGSQYRKMNLRHVAQYKMGQKKMNEKEIERTTSEIERKRTRQ